ncbi:MAG: mannose-1-phosphate guanylyltransferase/mannose-6-phosphate isomerase [Alphaproteobacteria bacterium]
MPFTDDIDTSHCVIEKISPILLCGGTGTRLWPLSRQAKPKQFLSLLDKQQSLFQSTLLRLANWQGDMTLGDMICVGTGSLDGGAAHQFFIHEQLKATHSKATILLEPIGRDSGPAILAASLYHQNIIGDKKTALLILPCDHHISYADKFYKSIKVAFSALQKYPDAIITFGILPHYPSKNYGYILPAYAGKKTFVMDIVCLPLKNFKEKPDEKIAKKYIADGYMWNSGIFLLTADTVIEAFQTYQPRTYKKIYAAVQGIHQDISPDWSFHWLSPESYGDIDALSFDYAIMEKSKKNMVTIMDKKNNWGWSDLGSFDEIKRIHKNDKDNNYIHQHDKHTPPTILEHAKNNLVINQGEQTITLLGVDNKAVVASKDALLVADINHLDRMKNLIKKLKEKNPNIVIHHSEVARPWGYYQSLKIDEGYQVKKLFLKPSAKISLQKHQHRSEHWVVVKGKAKVTLGDNQESLSEKILLANQSIYLPVGIIHRLENIGDDNLELIEVQTGNYLGEDDIERIEDIYRRS